MGVARHREARQRRALRLIGSAFVALAGYLAVQSTWALAASFHPHHSPLGIAWTAVTAAVMVALATGKASTGRALGNPVLLTEGRVTNIDGLLAVAVLLGLVLNATVGWWWARLRARLLRAARGPGHLHRRALTGRVSSARPGARIGTPHRQPAAGHSAS